MPSAEASEEGVRRTLPSWPPLSAVFLGSGQCAAAWHANSRVCEARPTELLDPGFRTDAADGPSGQFGTDVWSSAEIVGLLGSKADSCLKRPSLSKNGAYRGVCVAACFAIVTGLGSGLPKNTL